MKQRISNWSNTTSKMGLVISLNSAYFAWQCGGAGRVFNLKCGAEDSKAGLWGQREARWTALVRLSPAKSAFARLLAGRFLFYVGPGCRPYIVGHSKAAWRFASRRSPKWSQKVVCHYSQACQ
jgi:hypothetical protein